MKKSIIYKTKKTEYGITNLGNDKCFYKKSDYIDNELNGYNMIKDLYNVPSIIRRDIDVIYYEYKKELYKNTLHDCFYNKFIYHLDLKKILLQYENNLKNIVKIEEKDSRNSIYFKDKVNELKHIAKDDIVYSKFKYRDNIVCIKDILKETIAFLSHPKMVNCYLTQGNPTDTNIGINGMIGDFESAGYNSILGEISICLVSFLTHGSYFYPKYLKENYQHRKKMVYKYYKYEPKISYNRKHDYILLNSVLFNVPSGNRKFLKKYLEMYNNNLNYEQKDELNKYLKYYLITKLFTSLKFDHLERDDKFYILSYVVYVYLSVNSLDDLLSAL